MKTLIISLILCLLWSAQAQTKSASGKALLELDTGLKQRALINVSKASFELDKQEIKSFYVNIDLRHIKDTTVRNWLIGSFIDPVLEFHYEDKQMNLQWCDKKIEVKSEIELKDNYINFAIKVNLGQFSSQRSRILRTLKLGDKLLYIAGMNINNIQALPLELRLVSPGSNDREVSLPDGETAYDFLVDGQSAYLLSSCYTRGGVINKVYRSGDLNDWQEIFSFEADTFARSFEKIGGDFYFGMGAFITQKSSSTGRLILVSEEKIKGSR